MAVPVPRYESLDHWRGFACLLVLVNHSVWYEKGSALELGIAHVATRLWIGVPIFFVISGYCISAAVDGHRRRPGHSLRTYFTRRLRRIYPPYWAVLAGMLVTFTALDVLLPGGPLSSSGGFLRPWWYNAQQWLGNITLTEIWRYHVLPGQKALMLHHAWTLCYEEQFYVVAGALLWLMPGRFFLGASAVSVAVGVIRMATAGTSSVEGFFFDGNWFLFWFGVLVYYGLVYAGQTVRRLITAGLIVTAVVSALDPSRLLAAEKNDWQAFFVASVFAATALILARYDASIRNMRALSYLRTCGVMCYSLYLVHLPVANLLAAGFLWFGIRPSPLLSLLVSVPACLWVATWFHRVVERRFLNRPIEPSPRAVVNVPVRTQAQPAPVK